jgi:hypothetical protein
VRNQPLTIRSVHTMPKVFASMLRSMRKNVRRGWIYLLAQVCSSTHLSSRAAQISRCMLKALSGIGI